MPFSISCFNNPFYLAFSISTTSLLTVPRARASCAASGEKIRGEICNLRWRAAVKRLPPDVRYAARFPDEINRATVRCPLQIAFAETVLHLKIRLEYF